MSLIDWQTVTEPLGHYKTISAHAGEQYYVECVLVAFASVWAFVSVGGQITRCTLSVVTGCQVGPAHFFKDWQN